MMIIYFIKPEHEAQTAETIEALPLEVIEQLAEDPAGYDDEYFKVLVENNKVVEVIDPE